MTSHGAELNPLNGRWHHEATERQIKRALQEYDELLEWRIMQQTYWRSLKELIIVRTGIVGGDTYDIHGGWVYMSDISLRADWEEIKRISTLGRNN